MKYNKKWYNSLNRSQFSPPDWVFGIVWPILYTLMAISLYLVWTNKKCYPFCKPLYFFFIQLAFNLIWTTLFFVYKKPLLALLDIILILAFTIITYLQFQKINTKASYILIPYIAWLCFALYLNLFIVMKN